MATVSNWNPFGVALNLTATGSTVTRTSATQFTVKVSARWYTYYEGAKTNYGMEVSSGGHKKTISLQGVAASQGGEVFTGTYSISGNGSAKKTIDVVYRNFNTSKGHSASKTVSFSVTVPAWSSGSGSGSGSGSSASGKCEIYTVKAGDTLWGIAANKLGDGSKYKLIATWNNIKDPDKIYVGQQLHLCDSSGTTSSSSSNALEIKQFGLLSTSTNTLFATWDWSKNYTESYKVHWDYDVGNGIWLKGTHTDVTIDDSDNDPSVYRQSTYSIPDNAVKVRVKVKPIAEKKKDSKGNESYRWEIGWSKEKVWTDKTPLDTPSAPTVAIDKYKLTAKLDNIEIDDATSIIFQIVKNNSSNALHTSDPITIQTGHASYEYNVDPGAEYKVRCRAYNTDNKNQSEWSSYSSNTSTMPATPSGISEIRATSETSVYLAWEAVPTATSYDIEYATKKEYFDITNETKTETGIESTSFEIRGLESGTAYFFRIRATNSEGSSGWSEASSMVIGTKPAAPTTWSSTTTAVVGEPLTLYWVHNTEDGSSQTLAELELTINGATVSPAITIENLTSEEDKDKTRSCEIDTVNGYLRWVEDDGDHELYLGSTFIEGTKLQWRVRTAGITKTYGDWSIQRTVDIYAPPTLDLRITTMFEEEIETLEMFPFYIYALAGPNTQIPTGYHLEIVSNEFYETVDNIGNPKTVNSGEQVYSKYFDVRDPLLVEMSANNVDLENNISYTVTCTVSMNSGLTAVASKNFTVAWIDTRCEPNAEISVNMNDFTATIRPYCEVTETWYHKVEYANYKYTVTDTVYEFISGERVKRAKTTTGEQVYSGVAPDGEEIYYCIIAETIPVDDVYLSVYRREYDGSFTEIAKNLDCDNNTTVVDPHPALDYARYRIVATSKNTGAVSYYNLPGHPVGGTAIIIQWSEEWSEFDTVEGAVMEKPAWSGSLLKLPYNIDVSDSNSPDIELVEYIGRTHPLSYYGTQLGTTSSWNMVIPKEDKETLYGLRRLARWMGDVYVREPSGSGYWANVKVSFSQKHKEVTIPVTLSITRVAGGV